MVIETKEEVLLRQIDQLELSDRLRRWKEATLDAKPRICTERASLLWKPGRNRQRMISRYAGRSC